MKSISWFPFIFSGISGAVLAFVGSYMAYIAWASSNVLGTYLCNAGAACDNVISRLWGLQQQVLTFELWAGIGILCIGLGLGSVSLAGVLWVRSETRQPATFNP